MIGIYRITNKINKKSYIGLSKDIEKRLKNHKTALKNNRHRNIHLQNSYNFYGLGAFEFKIVCQCNLSDLEYLEKYYGAMYDVLDKKYGYNNVELGGNPPDHTKHYLRIIRDGYCHNKTVQQKYSLMKDKEVVYSSTNLYNLVNRTMKDYPNYNLRLENNLIFDLHMPLGELKQLCQGSYVNRGKFKRF